MDPNKPCSLIRVDQSQKPAVLCSNNATLPIFYTFLVGGPVEFIEKHKNIWAVDVFPKFVVKCGTLLFMYCANSSKLFLNDQLWRPLLFFHGQLHTVQCSRQVFGWFFQVKFSTLQFLGTITNCFMNSLSLLGGLVVEHTCQPWDSVTMRTRNQYQSAAGLLYIMKLD